MVIIKDNLEDVSILEVCDIQVGKTPSRDNRSYWGEGYPWLSIRDMNGKRTLMNTKESITQKAVSDCRCKIVPKNTVVYSFKLSIGKVGITGVPMYTNEAIAAFIIKDDSVLDTNYLAYVLEATDFSGGSNKAVMGKTLNKKLLEKFVIPLPSLVVQKEIVRKLDRVRLLIQKRKEAIDLLDQYLKNVFLEMFGDPISNPKKWPTKTIEEIVKKEKYSIKRGPFGGSLKKDMFVEDGYLVYEQFHALNRDFSFARYYIDEKKFQELKAFEVKAGDIIISCSGVYLGKLAEIPQNYKKGIINQALLKISLNNEIMRNKLFMDIFTDPSFKAKYLDNKIGSGIPNFPPVSVFKTFQFICPDINIQDEYENKVKNVENLREKMQEEISKLEQMMQSLSQKYFNN